MQDVTERARELRDAGLSFRLVAETLNAEGYRGAKGGLWHDGSVFRLLQPPKPPGPGRVYGPHTEESKRKMSESHKRGFAEGRRTPSRHNALKTHCPKGHPYDEENTYYPAAGGRQCKTCILESTRERRKRLREANPPVPRVLEKPGEDLDWRAGSPGRRAYGRMHLRVRRARGPAATHPCARCAERGTDRQADAWAIRHDCDGKDVNDYIPLCDRCHSYYDHPVTPEPPSVLYPLGLSGDGPGDKAIGQRRGEQQRAKTHCPHGHEYTEANTYIIKRAGGRTARQCRTCMREQREARRRGA